MSDVNGVAYDADGVDVQRIPSHDEEPEAVTKYANEVLPAAKLPTLDVDVLIPAAIGNVITQENADMLQADIVVEGTNGPTTSRGDEILRGRNIPVVPDILANAGGVTVSYFEWLQDINRRPWSLQQVNNELEKEMLTAWSEVRAEVEKRDVSWRDAAYIVALSRLAEAHEARGLWP